MSANVRPFVLMWCIYALAVVQLGPRIVGSGVHTDFRSFYAAGQLIRTYPSKLYNPTKQFQVEDSRVSKNSFMLFDHLAYEALVYAPFSMLDYMNAYFTFMIFNLFLLLAIFWTAHEEFSPVIPWFQPRPGLMLFIFFPLFFSLVQGQDSLLALLLYCITWRKLKSGKEISAGCVLALAIFKPQVAIPIAILIALRQSWRFSAGFLVASSLVTVLSVTMVGLTGMNNWLRLIHGAAESISAAGVAKQKVYELPLAMTNLAGLFSACKRLFPHSSMVFTVLLAICTIGLFVWCAAKVRRHDLKTAFAIATICGLLISYHLYMYDLTLALFPVALLSDRIPSYLMLLFFGLPIILIPLGFNSFFLLSIPLLLLLVSAIARSPHSIAPRSQPSVLTAR